MDVTENKEQQLKCSKSNTIQNKKQPQQVQNQQQNNTNDTRRTEYKPAAAEVLFLNHVSFLSQVRLFLLPFNFASP